MSNGHTYPDETLCAYLDGELQPDERAVLEKELARDAALRERLERFRGVTHLMQEAFGGAADEAVPETLFKAARGFAEAQGAASIVTPFQKRSSVPSFARWQLPLAACLALVVGGVVGGTFQVWRDNAQLGAAIATLDAGRIQPPNPLFAALERTPSGESVTTADKTRMHLILSFIANDERFCREFDIATPKAASVGIACKSNGAWRLEVLLAAKPQDLGNYKPASGFNARAFDDVVSALMKDGPIDQTKERDLIARGWR